MSDAKYNNLDEALEHARRFPITRNSSAYVAAIVLEHFSSGSSPDGYMYEVVERPSNPCWGFLRSYTAANGSTRPNDLWPSDLQRDDQIFPKSGKPVALCVKWGGEVYPSVSLNVIREYLDEILLNPETSPWKSLLKDVEVVLDHAGVPCALLFKDTKIDPTFLISFLRTQPYHFASKYHNEKKLNPSASPSELLMLAMFGQRNGTYSSPGPYSLSHNIEPKRFFNGNPYDLSNGRTFEEREDYNRPEVDFVFGGRKTQETFNDAVILYTELGKVSMGDRLTRLRELLS